MKEMLNMIDSLKGLFSRRGENHELELGAVAEWAQRCGHRFKRARGDEGFVIEGMLDHKPWRIEWGPSQRPYIAGRELRLRMALGLPSAMQMLLLSRPLMGVLERRTFEQFTDNVQTQSGDQTPEEMRWLVMFPKVNLSEMGLLRLHFGAVANQPAIGLAWVTGPLAHLLEKSLRDLLRGDPPFVLMTLRGRAYMRMQLASPSVEALAGALALFEAAVTQAGLAAEGIVDRRAPRESSAPTAWQSLQPAEPRGLRKRT